MRLASILLVFAVAACGVQRPLIKPADIPAFEAAKRAKREKIAREMQAQQQQDAADVAGAKAIEDAQ